MGASSEGGVRLVLKAVAIIPPAIGLFIWRLFGLAKALESNVTSAVIDLNAIMQFVEQFSAIRPSAPLTTLGFCNALWVQPVALRSN